MRLLQLILLLLLIAKLDSYIIHRLTDIVNELNTRLLTRTNIVYCKRCKLLRNDSHYLQQVEPIGQLVFNAPFNASSLGGELDKPVLFVVAVTTPPYLWIKSLEYEFQHSHFLFVLETSMESEDSWLQFIDHAQQLGYVKLLLHTPHNGNLYTTKMFPKAQLLPSNVSYYLDNQNLFDNMLGYGIRVASYHSPPRSLIYKDEKGQQVFGGYYMRLIRDFVKARNATFVPIFTTDASPQDCTAALVEERVDVCADALAANREKFSLTNAIRMAYANIMVANSQPLATYWYLLAPFHSTVWLSLIAYIGLLVSFMSFIHWRRQKRWIFSKFLLEAIRSLLFTGFSLRDLRGRERYILFVVVFIAGFIFATFYLAFLKSLLATEVFDKQINSFQDLVEANKTIMMDEYNLSLIGKYNLPEILMQLIEIVPMETLIASRNSFDQNYAYILFSDRMDLFDYVQQYLAHAHMRRIPINFFFLHAGFPMRKSWFLKDQLSDARMYAFDSGLLQKLAWDANFETMRVGWMDFFVTEYYEAQQLGLDYFVMPAIALGLGYSMALFSFLVELASRRICKPVATEPTVE
ncbi:uncharacterized protein LOC115624879 [Scaptodrosophila lebanonensis]|uniref:Uncharacterized protein LOC115624879 n=1 Tax=Drosophila lebanonensis TaxID=7225 RepID=A0A6J2TJE9_DROLE|nr:uncharacterized protein LOC115624879 [Scaptodrosophila lebanonensis]